MTSNVSGEVSELITQAVEASIEATFASICGQAPTCVSFDSHGEPSARVASVISFFGTHTWALTLIVPEPTAVLMAFKFAGFEVPFDSADMGDVVGELTNVLAGEVTAQLVARGIQAKMSLPAVARGKDVEMLRSSTTASRQLCYLSPQGHFWCDVCTASNLPSLCRASGAAM